jgi:hypothetical protein
MTIGKARILAIAISLAYIPAYIFGLNGIWPIFMALAAASLLRAQLLQAMPTAPQCAFGLAMRACRNIIENAALASIGFQLVLLSHFSGLVPASSAETQDPFITSFLVNTVFDTDFDYSVQPLRVRYLIDLAATSFFTPVSCLFITSSQARRVIASTISKAVSEQADVISRGQANLHCEALLYSSATIIFLVVFLCVVALESMLGSTDGLPQTVLLLAAPLLLFSSLAVFMLLITDFSLLRAYFTHPKRA